LLFILINSYMACLQANAGLVPTPGRERMNEGRNKIQYISAGDAFSALTLLVGRQDGASGLEKTEWWGAGVVV